MNVLVTGATGFLGSHLADRLVADGHVVTVLVRKRANRRWLSPELRMVEGALEDSEAVTRSIVGQERIFHVAGAVRAVKAAGFHAPNVHGMEVLVAAVRALPGPKPRVIHVSSLEAGGPASIDQPKRETDADAPASAYGRSKRDGESVLRAALDIHSVILRPCVVYGPRDIGLYEFYKIAGWSAGFALLGAERRASMVYVDDLVEAICAASEAPIESGEIFYIDDGQPAKTWLELQDLVAASLGRRRRITLRAPLSVFWAVCAIGELYQRMTGRLLWINRTRYDSLTQKSWCCDSSKASRLLGYRPAVKPQEGLARTARWYSEAGWIS